MPSTAEGVSRVSFGLFEADLLSGELWKAGRRIKLQSQPFKVLSALLERPGEVVTREELQLRLWGRNTVVDFDHSLGTAINKIREALGDSADNPRFVETLARRGYRFIAPVTVLMERQAAEVAAMPEGSGLAGLAPAGLGLAVAGPGSGAGSGEEMPVGAVSAAVEAPTVVEGSAGMATEAGVAGEDGGAGSLLPRMDAWGIRRRWWAVSILGVTALAAAASGFYIGAGRAKVAPPRIEQLTTSGRIAPGTQAMESLPASSTDGLRIYTPVIAGGRAVLSEVDIHTGAIESLPVPSEIVSPMLGDISPDGSKLLLRSHLSPESEQPLWIVPTGGGGALRIANIVAHDATWMPDGNDILYAAGDQLLVGHLQDGTSTPFATLPGRAFWMRWSPDGRLLRFTLTDPVSHTLGLWQIGADRKSARPILRGWTKEASDSACCGVWTGDGRDYVFQASMGKTSDLWRLHGDGTANPVRVTNGPLSLRRRWCRGSGTGCFYWDWIRDRSCSGMTRAGGSLCRNGTFWRRRREWTTHGTDGGWRGRMRKGGCGVRGRTDRRRSS